MINRRTLDGIKIFCAEYLPRVEASPWMKRQYQSLKQKLCKHEPFFCGEDVTPPGIWVKCKRWCGAEMWVEVQKPKHD